MTCGTCRHCREGRDNLCENVAGVRGFHVDGFAQSRLNMPARLLVPVPDGVALEDAACASITFGTVQHMLFDNAKLEPGETVLIHAAGSGIGSAAVRMAKAIGCTVIGTVGDETKAAKARELGVDHVVNYNTDRFESVARRVTGKRGVDVVFEHVGAATWQGSMLSMRMGGRLVTCGSTSGVSAETNLMMLFQRQLRLIGSFGCTLRNIRESLDKMAQGIRPVVDTVLPLARFAEGLERLESRNVFGKIVVTL
jgi:NADPH:quinone reductase-like Zn-dependent oxidoreductase